MEKKQLLIMLRALADSAGIEASDILRDAAKEGNPDPRQAMRAAALRGTLDGATSWAKRRGMDDQQALFVRNLVIQTLTEIERHEFSEAKWVNGGLITVRSEVNEGASEYGWYEQGIVAKNTPSLIADDADDLPLVDLTGAYNLGRTAGFGAAFRYTTQDVRKAQFMGTFDLVSDKASAVREKLDRDVNSFIAIGDTQAGFDGISNAKGIIVDTHVGTSWATATGDEISGFFRAMWDALTVPTGGVEIPNTFVTTQSLFTKLQTTTYNSAAGTEMILDVLKKSFPQITMWDWTEENLTFGEGGTPANMLYNRDPKKVRGEMPLEPVSLPEEQHGRKFKVETEGRWGGLIVKRPASILRVDGIV